MSLDTSLINGILKFGLFIQFQDSKEYNNFCNPCPLVRSKSQLNHP